MAISPLGHAVATAEAWSDGDFDVDDITGPISAGLGMLSAALDPVGALIAAPLGELLNIVVHKIKFLSEPLAKLEGSDQLVEAQAKAWIEIAKEYVAAGNAHAAGANDMASWSGPAAEAYHRLMVATNDIFQQVARAAEGMSRGVLAAGALVGMVRDFLWDMISQLIASAVSYGLAALAAAIPTGAASLALFAGWYTRQVAAIALRITQVVNDLLKRARALFKRYDVLRQMIERAMKHCDDFAKSMARMSRYAGRVSSPVHGPIPKDLREKMVPRGTLPGNTTAPGRRGTNPMARNPLPDPTPNQISDIPAAVLPNKRDVGEAIISTGKDIIESDAPEVRDID